MAGAITKPNLSRVWASNAPGANIVDPDTTTPDKFIDGWIEEIPPFEHFNFLQQFFTAALGHINQHGIAIYDVTTNYQVGAIAKHNNVIYQCSAENGPLTAAKTPGVDPEWLKFGFVGKDIETLYRAGIVTAFTYSNGLKVRNPTGSDSRLLLEDSAGISLAWLRQSGLLTEIRSFINGGTIRLTGEDTGGVLQTLCEGDPDGIFTLYNDGTLVVRTQTKALGALQIDKGAGMEEVAVLSDTIAKATILATTRTIGGVNFNGSVNIVPQTISVASEGADTTTYIALFNDTTGNQRPKTDSSLFFDTVNNVFRSVKYKANVGATIGEFSTDDTLAGSSNTVLPTENAVKNYVDNRQNILQAAMTSQAYGATSVATKFQLDAISGTTGYDLGDFTLSTANDRITNDTGRAIVVKASLFLLMDGVTVGSGEVSLSIRRSGSIMGESTENFIIGGVDQMLVLERVFELASGQYVEGWYNFVSADIMDVFTGSTLTVEYKGDV